jgi:nicotinamide riboside kinase
MRIGISGAQSVGKTTLLNALRSEQLFKKYKICDEVTRRVKSYGLFINENGNDLTQRLIMQEHIVNIFMNDSLITDRTALDGLVYTNYLREKDKVSLEAVKYAYKVFDKCIDHYDLIFYMSPEFDVEDDGVRSTDKEFRDKIVHMFEATIESQDIEVVRLTGSVRERTQQVIDAFSKKESEYVSEY